MVLTQHQEALIQGYLREVGGHLDKSFPEALCKQVLMQLKNGLYRELAARQKDALDDADVQAVLRIFGPPAVQAAQLMARRDPSSVLTLDIRRRVWLGVCGGLALRLGLEPWVIRALAVLAGITGPLAILAYLGVYLFLYNTSGPYAGPPIAKGRAAARTTGTFIAALLVHLAAVYGLRLIYFAHEQLLHRAVPPLGTWAWLETDEGELFFWAVVICTPLAALSAMPLPNAWDVSLKRFAQALLALYGVTVSFGLASAIAGIILNSVQEFTG
jgi:phage shock protein PspC (stress-responsive transcriptional regulator)